jgi:predicted RNase H-like nuclease
VNKHVLTESDKKELELQRYHALQAIDVLLADLPHLRQMVEEAPFYCFQREAMPVIDSIKKKGEATWVRVQLMFSTINGSTL